MDEGKVSFVVGVVEVEVVVVHLHGCELSLVDNVLVREGTDVEPLLEAESVRRLFSEDVELSLKVLLVEGVHVGEVRRVAIAVRTGEDDDGLEDDGLSREGSRTEDGGVTRDLSPTEHPEAERFGELREGLLRFRQ